MFRSLAEALVVIAMGVAVGLGVNASRGDQKFVISRNHFARKVIAPPLEHDNGVNNNNSGLNSSASELGANDDGFDQGESQSNSAGDVATPGDRETKPATESEKLTDPATAVAEDESASGEWKALIATGYQPIRHNEVIADFQSPDYEAGLIVFVDARDDAHYAKGHIAGAYQLDHYLLDNYIETVLPACQNAMKVIVYCNGGECEDSMFAAGDLIERGIDPNKVFVYVGGVMAWKRDGLPFEAGERYSGEEVYLNE